MEHFFKELTIVFVYNKKELFCTQMNQTFPKTLKQLRTKKGLSQQMLAGQMFVTRPTIARWESGARLPDAMMIKRLAEILGVNIDFLLSAAAQSDECPNVIMVDDRKVVLAGGLPVLEEALPNATITGFTNANEAIEYAKRNNISLAFLDIEIRNMSGFDLCKMLLEINPRTNIIFLTAFSDYSLDAWGTGASGFMLKPITVTGVKEQLKNLRYPFFIGEAN